VTQMKIIEYGKQNRHVVILLHGGGLNWWNMQEAAEMLADRFHVVLPVLDGHAESGHPFTSIEANADRLIRYIDETFDGQVLLIGGVSLGGQILVEMLSRRNAICDFAVIESALVLPMPVTAALIRPAFSMCYPLIAKRWFARWQFRSLRIKPALFECYYRDTCRIAKEDMTAFLSANARYRIRETLGNCSAKALVLAGGRERPIMIRSAQLLAGGLSDAKLEILKGYSHGELSINHADEYVQKLLRLME